jgi:hypothetical protein
MNGMIMFVVGFTLTLAIISIADVMMARACLAK